MQHSNNDLHFWRKIKTFLFGQLFIHSTNNFSSSENQKIEDKDQSPHLKDWLEAIDTLVPIVQTIRSNLDNEHSKQFDLELLGASTYLYHVDRLLIKLKEYLLTFRYRQDQFDREIDFLNKKEFLQVQQAGQYCHQSVLKLTELIQKLTPKQLYSDRFISQIHGLELDITSLGNAIRLLNQWSYRQEAIYQITTLEKNLFQTLSEGVNPNPSSNKQLTNYPGAIVPATSGLMYSQTESLKTLLPKITHEEKSYLVRQFIDHFETLKKCYVVAQKGTVKETLDGMGEAIKGLIEEFSLEDINKERTFRHLQIIFNAVESLKFSANRESRCSRHLFEKAKAVRHQLRVACLADPLGREFLQGIVVKRLSLVRKN